MICKICEQEVLEDSHYWKSHKIKQKDYFEKFYENLDKQTGELIEFKNKEQYFNTDFASKTNLKKYLEIKSKDEGLVYLSGWLNRRKKEKQLQFQLGEFECKSLCFPSVSFIEKFYGAGTYKDLCKLVGMQILFDYNILPSYKDDKELSIICDTREQLVLKNKNIQIRKLDYGDYASTDNTQIFVERKSLIDLVGTISKGYERFIKEIERCQSDGNYLIILIEEKYNNLLSFSYLPHMKRVQADETFILHRIRELIKTFPKTIQFLCVDGRIESAQILNKIFTYNGNIREFDLQWGYNNNLI